MFVKNGQMKYELEINVELLPSFADTCPPHTPLHIKTGEPGYLFTQNQEIRPSQRPNPQAGFRGENGHIVVQL